MLYTMLPKLFFISLLSSLIFTRSYSTQCIDHQKSLLLQLKNELIFNSSISTKLVQWNEGDECCEWYGVECDAAGHVISLQLDSEAISGGIGDSSSLFRLMYLEKLNLAYNGINSSTPIPKGIQNLTYLTHLNLSHAGFDGQVPLEISSLSRFVSLDISFYIFSSTISKLDMLLQNMTGLRELYLDDTLSSCSYDESTKWNHIISSYLPNLTTLSLRYTFLFCPFPKYFSQHRSLSILRLDYNDLSTVDPYFFTNFSSLTTLSLAECRLHGSFPKMIFQIPTLQNIDLSRNEGLSGSIPPFIETGSLKSIVLSGTNFTGLIPPSISNLTSLSKIDLSHCQFTGSIDPSTFANLTQLAYVDLSHNFFNGSIPSTFANLTQLAYVDLSHNNFTGLLSSALFGGLSDLVSLNLVYNSLSGSIPHSLFGLPSLLELHLSNNKFIGLVEEFHIANVSNIVKLDLSGNRLEGPIPDSFFQLHSLETLSLSGNMFNGSFQLDKIRSLANLTSLDLSGNKLSVNVSNDNSSAYGLPQLQVLGLASCNLYGFPDFIKHSDRLTVLDLSNNQIAGEIPSWVWGRHLYILKLSLNLLTDVQKPYHIPSSLFELDLSSNQFQGDLFIPPKIGNLTSEIRRLLLANNSFSGSIPISLCSVEWLRIIDLSVNKLSGTIPSCLSGMAPEVLYLGQNNISGPIPDNFPLDCRLQYLDLSNNTLEGKIPKSLQNCKGLEFMNVGNNIIGDTFPCMLSSTLRVLVLHSNRFHGEVRCRSNWTDLQILDISSNNFSGSLESINFSSWRAMSKGNDAQLGSNFLHPTVNFSAAAGVGLTMKGAEVELLKIRIDFTAVDLSSNNFRGEIPEAIGDLSSLHHLNFSHNALNGSIPKSFGRLRNLEALDLSQNLLTGPIPMELTGLTFLEVFNVSYNKLVGEIPNGRQLQTFSADSFKGNAGLCGFNLNISCTSHTDDDSHSPHEKVEEKREIEWEYVCAALGYVVGLGSIVWLLLFCRSFRQKYFGKIEEVVEEIFDARDRRRRRRRRASRVVRNRVRRQ